MSITPSELEALVAAIANRADSEGDNSAQVGLGDPNLPLVELLMGGQSFGFHARGSAMLPGSLIYELVAGIGDYLVRSLLPPKSILPTNVSAADIADLTKFNATGLGVGLYNGWAVCNGNNGTPDLNTRFLRGDSAGAGTTGGSSSTGGPSTDTSGASSATNSGTPSGTTVVQSGAGATVASSAHTHTIAHTHSLSAHTHTGNEPPYYNVIYLMKL